MEVVRFKEWRVVRDITQLMVCLTGHLSEISTPLTDKCGHRLKIFGRLLTGYITLHPY